MSRRAGHPGSFLLLLVIALLYGRGAIAASRRKSFTVSDPTALARRMREAFIGAFGRGGGNHIAEYAYTTDAAALERLRQAAFESGKLVVLGETPP